MAENANDATRVAGRPLDLAGDSPELIAFALLRYLAQIEQQQDADKPFDRAWMLDAYAECLDAVRGKRKSNHRLIRETSKHPPTYAGQKGRTSGSTKTKR